MIIVGCRRAELERYKKERQSTQADIFSICLLVPKFASHVSVKFATLQVAPPGDQICNWWRKSGYIGYRYRLGPLCNVFQLCQLAIEDAHYVRHHDDNVTKTANIVDGNIQAGWKIYQMFQGVWSQFVSIEYLTLSFYPRAWLGQILQRIWGIRFIFYLYCKYHYYLDRKDRNPDEKLWFFRRLRV